MSDRDSIRLLIEKLEEIIERSEKIREIEQRIETLEREQKFFTLVEAAHYLKIGYEQMSSYVHRKKLIIPTRRAGKTLLFSQADLDRFREELKGQKS